MIHSHMKDIDLCAETNWLNSSSGIMTKSEQINYLIKGAPKDNYWMFSTKLVYDKIVPLADNLEKAVQE